MYQKFEELIREKQITAFKVSQDTGIPASTFSDWKSGRSKPKVDKLMKLAAYFSVPVETFIEQEK